MNDPLLKAWNSFSREWADEYLKARGHPSLSSKRMLVELLRKEPKQGRLSIVDFGCGNAQLYGYFREEGLDCDYLGLDISGPLLDTARRNHRDDPHARFLEDDINDPQHATGHFDVALYSHVLEILPSPEASLRRAKALARRIWIRFFEPPEFEMDTVELLEMEVGEGKRVPYLRRKMSRDYYRLILSRLGCTRVDVYRDAKSKDQIHCLQY